MRKNGRKSGIGWALAVVMLFILLLTPEFCHAGEWQTVVDDTRLTYANGDSWHSSLGVDSNGNVHVTWQDSRDGNDEIYYTKLDNNGNTLVDDTRLTFDIAESSWPNLELDGSGNVHIIWRDSRNSSPELYYTKLDNNGNVLVHSTRLTYGSNHSYGHNVKVDSHNNLHVAWVDYRNGDPEIYYAKLDNNGNRLLSDIRLTSANGASWWPNLGVDSGDNIHMAWYDARTGNGEIYYKKLDNNGNTLVDDTRLTFAGGAVGAPGLGVDNSNDIHIIWADSRNGETHLYYTKLDNIGNTLIDDRIITTLGGCCGYGKGVSIDGNVHITFSDDRDGNDEIYYTELDNNGNTLVSDTRLTFDGSNSWWPRLCVDSTSSVHIIWDDDRDGNREIYYIKGSTITGTAVEWPGPGDAPGMPRLAITSLSPNPFNPVTHVSFQSQDWGRVKMEIYDVAGRLVRSVPLGRLSPGPHTGVWDGNDAKGASVPSGVYFIRLRNAVSVSQPVKAVVVR